MTALILEARPGQRIGVDLVAPFCVYVDGQPVAEFCTQGEAIALYARLCNREPGSQ
jgi:hypothetical protein